MSKAGNLGKALLVGAAMGLFDRGDEGVVEDMYDDGYSVDEIVDELDMDEEDVREIVGEDEEKDNEYYDY